MDPPFGAGASAGSATPPGAAAFSPGGALANATREQLVKAVERSAKKLKAADERAQTAEAASARALSDVQRVTSEAALALETERTTRRELIRTTSEETAARTKVLRDRCASMERSLHAANAETAKAQAESRTSRDALSRVASTSSATQSSFSDDTVTELGKVRAALDEKHAEVQSLKEEMEKVGTNRDAETKRVVVALADIKKKMQKLEGKREDAERLLKQERLERARGESRLETKVLTLETRLSEAYAQKATSLQSEKEYKQRAGALFAAKDLEIESLKKSMSDVRPANGNTPGDENHKDDSTTHALADTLTKLKREVGSLTIALRESESRQEKARAELRSVRFDAEQRAETFRDLSEQTNAKLSRARSERNTANVAADDARKVVTTLEEKQFAREASVRESLARSDLVAKNAQKKNDEFSAKYDSLSVEFKNARESYEQMLGAKDRELGDLQFKFGDMAREVGVLNRRLEAGVPESNKVGKKVVTSYDDDDEHGLEAFTAYVLGETGGDVDLADTGATTHTSHHEKNESRGIEPATAGSSSLPDHGEWDFGVTKTLTSVYDYFGGGDSSVSALEPSAWEQTGMGANASAAANALLASRGTEESK